MVVLKGMVNFATYNRLYICPQESKSGGKYLQKHNALKNFIPSGVSPPRGSPAISLPLLFSNWLVPLPGLPQWHCDKDCNDGGAPQADGGLLVEVHL